MSYKRFFTTFSFQLKENITCIPSDDCWPPSTWKRPDIRPSPR